MQRWLRGECCGASKMLARGHGSGLSSGATQGGPPACYQHVYPSVLDTEPTAVAIDNRSSAETQRKRTLADVRASAVQGTRALSSGEWPWHGLAQVQRVVNCCRFSNRDPH